MLSKRFDFDERPLLELNELQLKMKTQVEQKVKESSYKFENVPCAVCDGNNFESLAKKDRYGLYMPVVICRDCGLIQTNPRMNQNAYNEFYNYEYRKLYVGMESPTDKFFQSQYNHGLRIVEYFKSCNLIKSFKNMLVLEVGCGAGGILHFFREQGCRVKGIDLGESYIEYGRNEYDLDLSVGTIDTLDIDEAPNLIIYSHVLEHILKPNDELRKVYNILSDAGLLYVEIPGVKNLMNSYEMDFLRLLQNAHTYHFSLRSLTNLIERNNFEALDGNEVVNSVYRKAQGKNSPKAFENDYSNVMSYLRKVESLRKRRIIYHKLKSLPMSIVVKILKAVGLFEPVRNLYHKIKIS